MDTVSLEKKRVTIAEVIEDIRGASERMVKYQEQLRQSEEIVIVVGCDDARVGVPFAKVDNKSYILVPTIGGGAPEKATFVAILTFIKDLNIRASQKVSILLTQHGDQTEIDAALRNDSETACGNIGCGLRKFIEQYREQLKKIKNVRDSGNTVKAGKLIEALSTETGFDSNLINRAIENNGSSYIFDNLMAVRDTVLGMGLGVKEVATGYYDHNNKTIYVTKRFNKLARIIDLGLQKWNENYQDPDVITISFGPRSVITHNGILLPKVIGQEPGRSFDAIAASTQEQLLTAFAEASYAAINAGNSGHGANFKSTRGCIVICDNEQYVEGARELIESDEFYDHLGKAFLVLDSIILTNLRTEGAEEVLLRRSE